jgi:ABC-type transporter MlaC component
VIVRRLAACALVLLAASPALAGEPTDRLRTLFEQANRVLLSPELEGLEERVAGVRTLVNEVFDFEGAATLALGRHWEQLPPPSRAEFVRLYADLIERAYLAWIGSKARVGAGGVTSRWTGESAANDVAMVSSLLLTRSGDEMPIDYLMIRRPDQAWVVRDVVVDGLSLAANYHVQFGRLLQTESYDELFARLREKAGPLARAQATAAAASALHTMIAAPAPSPSVPPIAVAVPPAPAAPETVAEAAAVPAPVTPVRPLAVAQLREYPRVVSDATPAPAPILPAPAPVVREPAPSAPPVAAPTSARPQPAPILPAPSPTIARVPEPVASTPARPAVVIPATPPRPHVVVDRAAPGGGQFWVQAGAFRSAEAASRLVERLRRHAVTLALDGSGSAPLARVLVGPFVERAAAAATVRELRAGGIAAFVADTPPR